ncbi:hypothetical protein FGO68_gene12137 [Halteria grandinella]|uniref:MaoC-like domain-containing protein n=1 Tax=Halteria grandinella TaxID=5974 RepID=A0A8J8NKX3_HALGN|nr:hypothetical protein FGO68_gene12137 [Halteria grandinella]
MAENKEGLSKAEDPLIASLIGKEYSRQFYNLTHDQAALYSLATGLLDNSIIDYSKSQKYLYENDKSFSVFPTMANAFAIKEIDHFFKIPELKKLIKYDNIPSILLHGEEETRCFTTLEAGEQYGVISKIVDIIDKGKLTIIVVRKDIESVKSKRLHSSITSRYVLQGVGGFGSQGGRVPSLDLPKVSEFTHYGGAIPTLPQQNALYRLTGDKNLIHIDPAIAKKAGLGRPILHGLCTYGITARAVFEKMVAENILTDSTDNIRAITEIGARFTAPVYPGETLDVQINVMDKCKIYYETKVKERKITVLKGYLKYRKPISAGIWTASEASQAANRRLPTLLRKLL